MKSLCLLLALGVLFSSTIDAAPTNLKAENQKLSDYLSVLHGALEGYLNRPQSQTAEMQGFPWGPIIHTLGPEVLHHFGGGRESAKSLQDNVEAKEQITLSDVARGALGAVKYYDRNRVDMQGFPWIPIIKHLGPAVLDHLGGDREAEKSLQDNVEAKAQITTSDVAKGALGLLGYYDRNAVTNQQEDDSSEGERLSQDLLKKLEKVVKEQDGDIITAIESLPEEKKAQVQFFFLKAGLPWSASGGARAIEG